MAGEGRRKDRRDPVSLEALLRKEVKAERAERSRVRYGCALQAKKGEDHYLMKTDCQRVPGNASSTFSVFGIFDGHSGSSAAIYTKDHLLSHVMGAIPRGLSRDEWLKALPRALVAAFVKTDKEFQRKGENSGTTATFVIVDGWTITVASVGDSRCILDAKGGELSILTVDHRLEENAEERERVTASGGQVGRLSVADGAEVGPLRCWPGGLCLSRSIGDVDVGEFIVPVPHVKQVKLSPDKARLIIASDGIWDALTSETAAQCCRELPAEIAACKIVKESLRLRGLKDDTTCIVVDILPPDESAILSPPPPPSPKKTTNSFKPFSCWGWPPSADTEKKAASKVSSVSAVEEIFEEGSALLSERLGHNLSSLSLQAAFGVFECAICQSPLDPNEGGVSISSNSGSFLSSNKACWQGPFLCEDCRNKKDAMEGKRPSGVKAA